MRGCLKRKWKSFFWKFGIFQPSLTSYFFSNFFWEESPLWDIFNTPKTLFTPFQYWKGGDNPAKLGSRDTSYGPAKLSSRCLLPPPQVLLITNQSLWKTQRLCTQYGLSKQKIRVWFSMSICNLEPTCEQALCANPPLFWGGFCQQSHLALSRPLSKRQLHSPPLCVGSGCSRLILSGGCEQEIKVEANSQPTPSFQGINLYSLWISVGAPEFFDFYHLNQRPLVRSLSTN